MSRIFFSCSVAMMSVLLIFSHACEDDDRASQTGDGLYEDDTTLDTEIIDTDPDPDPIDTEIIDTGDEPAPDSSEQETEVCSSQDFEIEFLDTRLMILQDISGSMSNGGGWGGDNAWAQAQKALSNMLNNPANTSIEFGFDVFPDDGDCGVEQSVVYDAAPNAASAIISSFDNHYPNGNTPLCQAMQNFNETLHPTYSPAFHAPGAQRYLLIVTDGEASCGNTTEGCMSAGQWGSTDLADRTTDLLDQGIKTFVIGFNMGNSSQLNSIAKAGGTGHQKFINVTNEDQLQQALESIAATVVSCTFDIAEPDEAADPEKVNFRFDGDIIYRDDDCADGSGWRWVDDAHTQVEFCSDACELVQSGDVANVSAEFGCPTEVLVK